MDKDIAQNSLHKLQYINQLAKITLFKTIIPNIFINRTFKRDYPSSDILSHVIGRASPHSFLGGVLSHVIAKASHHTSVQCLPSSNIIAKASPHSSLGGVLSHVIASEAWQSPKDRLLKIATALAEPRNDVLKQSLAMTY